MTASVTNTDLLKPPSRPLGQQLFDLGLWGGIIVLLVISFGPAEMSKLPKLFENSDNMRQFGREFLHPDFSDWTFLVSQMWLTVQIALWGTAIAVLIAVPLGLLGARNVTPSYVQLPVRRLMDVLRSVPDTLYVHDMSSMRVMFSNNRLGPDLGYSKDELRQFGERLWEKILHPDDVELYQRVRNLQKVVGDGQLLHCQLCR